MSNYDYSDDFYGENEDYNDYYIEENDAWEDEDENDDIPPAPPEDNFWNDDVDDSMDGDHESALASAGWGTDEDYGHYSDYDREDFHADESVGFVDYYEDGPYDD